MTGAIKVFSSGSLRSTFTGPPLCAAMAGCASRGVVTTVLRHSLDLGVLPALALLWLGRTSRFESTLTSDSQRVDRVGVRGAHDDPEVFRGWRFRPERNYLGVSAMNRATTRASSGPWSSWRKWPAPTMVVCA